MRKLRALAAIGIGAAVLGLACNAIVGIDAATLGTDADAGPPSVDGSQLQDAESPEAAADGASDVVVAQDAADAGSGCNSAFPPPRPTVEDGTLDLEIDTALRSLDLGVVLDGGTPPIYGYDLDHVCTCFGTPPGPESCKARVVGATHCDEPNGRDNSAGELLRTFTEVTNGAFDPTSINTRVNQGAYGLVLRLRHYNGGMNDQAVELAVFVSNGTPLVGDSATPPAPAWDGKDSWTLDSDSVVGMQPQPDGGMLDVPSFVDVNAYVAGGVLVASVDFPLTLGGGNSGVLTLQLTGSAITANVVAQGSSYRLDNGVLAGRWATAKLLASLGATSNPLPPGGFICPGTAFYNTVKSYICKGADIFVDPTATDPTQPCDAISIGMGFTAYPAVLGPVTSKGAHALNCDAGIPPDDCN